MLIKCEPGDTIILQNAIGDRVTTLYPRTRIYDSGGNLVDTVDLTHTANGLYQNTYTVDGTYKQLIVHHIVYSDSGHTTVDENYSSANTDIIYCGYDFKPAMGGGVDFAPILEEIKKIKKPDSLSGLKKTLKDIQSKIEQLEKKPSTSYRPLLDKIESIKGSIKPPIDNTAEIKKEINKIKIPKPLKPKDYTSELKEIKNTIKGIEFPKTDLTPITEKVDSVNKELVEQFGDIKGYIDKRDDGTRQIITETAENQNDFLNSDLQEKTKRMTSELKEDLMNTVRTIEETKSDIKKELNLNRQILGAQEKMRIRRNYESSKK